MPVLKDKVASTVDKVRTGKSQIPVKKAKSDIPVVRMVSQASVYDPTEDWDVEHNGSIDPDTGAPLYDQSPVKGGLIIAHNYRHTKLGETVNAEGHEIDVDDIDPKTNKPRVLDPDRYVDDEPNA